MNRLILSIAVVALSLPTAAQHYILVNNEDPIPFEDVVNITYEKDSEFKNRILPNVLSNDARVTLFSQALQLTGLADTLKASEYVDYKAPDEQKYYYQIFRRDEDVAWYNAERIKSFTVFAETDEIYAANGISNIEQLKAYAKQIYDEAYPEDADISDPTDRRNSLNRFVAYHILPHGNSYWYLTYYDGLMTDKFTDTNLADIATWYATMMPHASLKCSYPMAGDESGLYLNHRGLKDGPDKYGKLVRGAKIMAGEGKGKDPFTQRASNGFYYYIDRILAYDLLTRNEVLGSELWRVDFKTISPDIMNNAEDLRGNYMVNSSASIDDKAIPYFGRSHVYQWDCIENIKGDLTQANAGIIARRAYANNPIWQGDELVVLGNFSPITVKLPPLPAGEWEVRMGTYAEGERPDVKIYLNGQLTIDKLKLTRHYYSDDLPFWIQYTIEEELRDYMTKTVFVVTEREDHTFLVTDVRTGEQIVCNRNPYIHYSGGQGFTWKVSGTDATTGEEADWTERATTYHEQAVKDYIATLPKVMKAPNECMSFVGPFSISNATVRYVLGRIQSDGKSDNYLQIEACGTPAENSVLQLDYLELVPKAIYDNPDIPEE